MADCKMYHEWMLLAVANELADHEWKELRDHLRGCVECQSQFLAEQALSGLLVRTRPLYLASAELHAGIEEIWKQHRPAAAKTEGVPQRTAQAPWGLRRTASRRSIPLKLLVPSIPLVLIGMVFIPQLTRQVRAETYVSTAVAVHRKHLDGRLALAIRSASANAVDEWLAHNFAPHAGLRGALMAGPSMGYRIVGAGLTRYKQCTAALVTFEYPKGKVSLMIAPTECALVAGGEEMRYGPVVFHTYERTSVTVVAWTTRGLSYAMVYPASISGKERCLICHQPLAEQDASDR